MDKMHRELLAAGHPHAWIGLHGASANNLANQREIHSKTAFPLLQELPGKGPRGPLGAKTRSDVFVFDAVGALVERIQEVTTAHTKAGYANLLTRLEADIP